MLPLNVWIQVKHNYPLSIKIKRKFDSGLVFIAVAVDLDLEIKQFKLSGKTMTKIDKKI